MNNLMTFNEYKAVIVFDSVKNNFRGEFIGLNGDVSFCGDSINQLQENGQSALNEFLNMCEEDGKEPKVPPSNSFTVNMSPALYEQATIAATTAGKTLDQWVADKLTHN